MGDDVMFMEPYGPLSAYLVPDSLLNYAHIMTFIKLALAAAN